MKQLLTTQSAKEAFMQVEHFTEDQKGIALEVGA